MQNKCRICAKQYFCKEENCKQIKFSETKNLGEVKYERQNKKQSS